MTLEELLRSNITGMVRVYGTATKVTWTEEGEEPLEEYGWTDDSWSRSAVFESRNDVAPMFECSAHKLRENENEELEDLLAIAQRYEWTDDGSTWYMTDASIPDLREPVSMHRAMHVHVRHYAGGSRGWVEDDLDLGA